MHAKESWAMEKELKEPEGYQKAISRVLQTKKTFFLFSMPVSSKSKTGHVDNIEDD